MKPNPRFLALRPLSRAAAMAAAMAAALPGSMPAQTNALTLANPNWNITLTDYGYSDFLLDNTPGFEGREYLSGEWGAAVGYQLSGGTVVSPQWLEPNFSYPDWVTNSTFHVVSTITQTGLNADGLPIAVSVIANGHLEITLRHEMLDTVTGMSMGTAAASAGGNGAYITSNRYVLKQTCTIKNISGGTLSNLQFFQLLHGLQSQRGTYDNRTYAGPLGTFHHDVTMAGVDAWATGAGSSSAGLEDFLGFSSSTAPSGYEIGYYGIEGNGVDNHSIGKPSEGVHLSIEDNWQTSPYTGRFNTDSFAPPQRWVAGTQRWNLGNLVNGQSVSHDVLLGLCTGTRVTAGTGSSGGCNGGSGVPGGLDYQFEDVTSDGSCFAEFSRANESELAVRVAAGEFPNFTFLTPGNPAQVWDVRFTGTYSGAVNLTLAYDPTLLPAGFDESTLAIHHYASGSWHALPSVVDPLTHTITLSTDTLGPFALGVDGGVTFDIAASVAPANSGTVTGAGPYAQAASATLTATKSTGYVFANWTENGSVVSTSPNYTFAAQGNRTLVANFVAVGTAKTISTGCTPSNGGTTSGDGAYALGASATVVATKNPGYKFSKWQENGATVSTSSSYTFKVTGDRLLVAKFKPVYSVAVTAEPDYAGTAEADSSSYESGEKAQMKAIPEPGYSLVNWTQNGVPVSTDEIFTFNVTSNRELVAHFALGNRIDTSSDPKTAGVANGSGVYPNGQTVTLVAEAKPGYVFTNWTEGGSVVATSATFDFPSNTNRALVANFIPLPTINASTQATGGLTISWPAGATGWVLEECSDLNSGTWAPSGRPVTVEGNQKKLQVTTPTGSAFFRLAYP